MDALSVVTQLRDLASEPQNREMIVKDQGCLPGLVLFLDHQNQDVLFATLQVSGKRGNGILNCESLNTSLSSNVTRLCGTWPRWPQTSPP